MPITINQAKQLCHGDIIYHNVNCNLDGSPQRWKVNGVVKLWKRDKNRIKIPLKYGLYRFDYLTENELDLVSLTEEEAKR